MVAVYAGVDWLCLYNALRFNESMTAGGVCPGLLYAAISGALIGLAFSTRAWLWRNGGADSNICHKPHDYYLSSG